MYVRKEALLSSQIEGTQSSLSDLLLFELKEALGALFDDVREVSNYVRAIELGLRKLRDLPLSSRLLREIHRVLLAKGRGTAKEPGEFRRSQNWVSGPRPSLPMRLQDYDLLQRVRHEGDWESWIRFFVVGVRETADQAVHTARRLVSMFCEDREKIESGGHGAGSALRVHHALQQQPLLSIARTRAKTRLSVPTITSAFRWLERAGIVRETTGRKRGRLFGYDRYLEVLSEGTGPL